MYEFKYHRPGTVRQAANLLAKNEDAKLIAGGHTLVPVMKQRLASPPHLVDLSHIEGLDGIEMKGRNLVIGATARHADVANSPKEETRLRKFTFAELEEIEDDLNKLSAWFAKIKTRDFFPDARIQKATEQFETCGTALTAFAEEVYAHEGVNAPIECDADPLDANGREHAPKHPGRRQHG